MSKSRGLLNIQFDKSGINAMMRYLRALESKKFPLEIKRNFENDADLQELENSAKEIVQALVYDVWPDPGTRTYNLLESVTTATGGDSDTDGQINLYSDPRIATAKYYPTFSYAAFFEEPEAFNTFIHPRGQADNPANFRPFFSSWVEITKQYSIEKAQQAVHEALDRLMPDALRRTVAVP
jgi:hypothetical protein